MTKKPIVVIQSANRWNYFQWFLLGLYELEKEGKIKVKFNLSFEDKLSSNYFTRKIGEKLKLFRVDSYNLNGYVLYPDNTKKFFCIDSADSPYLYSGEDLKNVACYFKMQCPKDLTKEYFALTDEIHIPWLDHKHVDELYDYPKVNIRGERALCKEFNENRYKIRPLMIGPRRLGSGIRYKSLKKAYDNYFSSMTNKKQKKVMCYFGNSEGPMSAENIVKPDLDKEKDIMGYFGNKISHPNEKRAIVSNIINSLGNEYDGRIICQGNSDSNQKRNESLIVPIKDFCSFISQFQYNFNVSGYRLSIPNRFIESFMVGTGIVTDKLSVKWYLPFDKNEVVETVKMGYLKNEDINWKRVKEDLINLPKSNPDQIIDCFEQKWSPKRVASYILDEIKKTK